MLLNYLHVKIVLSDEFLMFTLWYGNDAQREGVSFFSPNLLKKKMLEKMRNQCPQLSQDKQITS